MEQQERSEFVAAYTKVLTTAWSSDEYSERLDRDPTAAVAECGIIVPAGGTVTLVREVPPGVEQDATLDRQINLWERGKRTGTFELHVPHTPLIDTAELSEGDLQAVAGGDNSCCCCPCCCCT